MSAASLPPPVLITGGCGFIGCNLADALASRGRTVLVLDNLSRAGAEENARWLKARHGRRVAIERGDVRRAAALQPLVRRAGAVLHLAAQVAVTTSLDDPIRDFEVNARGTLNLLECVRRHNPQAPVVFASTNKVYGRLLSDDTVCRRGQRYVPCDPRLARGVAEDVPLDLYSPYGCSKGAADQYVRDYARVFGLRTVVLRMSCIYGPRQFGTEDQGWLAHFLIRTLRGRPLTIYGDGCQVRDALFIDDAVAAWLAALDRADAVAGRVFNLGGGPANALSLLEAAAAIGALCGRRPSLRFARWRPGDQPWYVSDIRAAASALHWSPRTPLPDGLRALKRWIVGRLAAPARAAPLEAAPA
ncbi:MAG: NAD-dependent epimerase/dehydratase family protein [Rhodospirillaceae bacterium]|nr:NAD-dependent epimerase/dehydratase family protein [Rhodospirillaceae bacterium]